jgi:hypothetical protein
MPRLLTALQIATEALMEIGAFSTKDVAPDPDELDRALSALDLRVQQETGTMRTYWLIPADFTIPLAAGQASYNLMTVLGAQYPRDGIQFALSASLQPPGGLARIPLDIIRRDDLEALSLPTQPGQPESVYVDRKDPPTLTITPVINLPGYSVLLTAQVFSTNHTTNKGAEQHGMPAAWQRWAILATAEDIGAGKVRRLPQIELSDLRARSKEAFEKLAAFSNKERFGRKRFTQYRDF